MIRGAKSASGYVNRGVQTSKSRADRECSSDSFATKLSAFSYRLENIYNKRKEFYKMMRTETINKPQNQESPIIRTEYNGMQVTITFDENAGDKDIKQIIMDILTRAYERRIAE